MIIAVVGMVLIVDVVVIVVIVFIVLIVDFVILGRQGKAGLDRGRRRHLSRPKTPQQQ